VRLRRCAGDGHEHRIGVRLVNGRGDRAVGRRAREGSSMDDAPWPCPARGPAETRAIAERLWRDGRRRRGRSAAPAFDGTGRARTESCCWCCCSCWCARARGEDKEGRHDVQWINERVVLEVASQYLDGARARAGAAGYRRPSARAPRGREPGSSRGGVGARARVGHRANAIAHFSLSCFFFTTEHQLTPHPTLALHPPT
jgi:hypothetical protein